MEKGKRYAIVGPSGSGKTTLLNIIGQLYEISDGELLLDQKNVTNGSELLDYIAYVHQEPFIFHDTLQNNLTLFQKYDQQVLKQAIEFSGLAPLLKSEGFHKICAEDGTNLSGGEKQRISIARAYLRKAALILLDESASALDVEMGQAVEENLLKLKDQTLVFVTHKLKEKFLLQMDRSFFLEDGKITEEGTYQQLLSNQKRFYHFMTGKTNESG